MLLRLYRLSLLSLSRFVPHMDALKRTLIEKAGHDFGFEYTVSETSVSLTLGSARHSLHVEVKLGNDNYQVQLANAKPMLISELKRDFSITDNTIITLSIEQLATLFKRTAALAHSLPNQAEQDYELVLKEEFKKLPDEIKNTEVERLVRQRVGQDTYRKAMLEYWGGACAVTGVAIPEILRASHAKPWAECESDAQRLDVFNGFLLSANLDALFDRGLISFDEQGSLLVGKQLTSTDLAKLGVDGSMRLRWLADDHLEYLCWHRDNLFK